MNRTFQKIVLIFHLCICFSLLLWQASEGFAEHYYLKKDALQIYENIMGHPNLISRIQASEHNDLADKLTRHQQRFQNLPLETQNEIHHQYKTLKEEKSTGFLSVIAKTFTYLAFHIPPLFQLWLALSICAVFLTLFKISGGKESLCLLPLILAVYLFFIPALPLASETKPSVTFPTEKELVDKYINEELSTNYKEQKEQLLKAWKHYLAEEWSLDSSTDLTTIDKRAEDGEFQLNLYRASQRWNYLSHSNQQKTNLFHSYPLTYALIIWSLIVCLSLYRSRQND
ncbi:MAG: hypothetical protein L7U87_00660 [Chlamydiales bacterium]|nr:hypothetical protein [Chlamydiales bacterium]